MERFAPGGGAIRPRGWSESPHSAACPRPRLGIARTNRESRARIGKFQHESGMARTNREIPARIRNRAHESGAGAAVPLVKRRSIPDAIPVILASPACPPLSHRGPTSGPCPRLRSSALSGPPQSWIPFPSAAQTVRMRGALRCRAWWPCGSRSRGGENGSSGRSS